MSEEGFLEEIKEAIEGEGPNTPDKIDNRLTE